MTSEQSSFGGDFALDFTGEAKGNLGPIEQAEQAEQIELAEIMGLVYEDFNNDGQVNFGETAISGVTITLTGTNDLGDAVNLVTTTDSQGIYMFIDLRPGTYTVTETQPASFDDGIDTLGTVDSVFTGNDLVNDQFSEIALGIASQGENYNFGEQSLADVTAGQTATIGYWQNKNGQNLIKSLNGGSNSTRFSSWLSTTFPNMYGDDGSGAANPNDLTGMTNAEVAGFYKTLFKRKKRQTLQLGLTGPDKMDSQVLAAAIATYVTNENLAGTTAAAYGFLVTADGLGTATYNVGSNGAAFGVADNAEVTVLDLLLAVNDHSSEGLLYDLNGDSDTQDDDLFETLFRTMANDVFSGINEQGDI